jgi:hypothetical protein
MSKQHQYVNKSLHLLCVHHFLKEHDGKSLELLQMLSLRNPEKQFSIKIQCLCQKHTDFINIEGINYNSWSDIPPHPPKSEDGQKCS